MSRIKTVLLYVMGVVYVFAGVLHFVATEGYVKIMPSYLPWHLELVYLSGVAEIVCGIGLVIPQTRVIAAWATVALLIAIFPANINVAVYNLPMGGATEGAGVLNWVRLPIQFVLIAWAWWYTRGE